MTNPDSPTVCLTDLDGNEHIAPYHENGFTFTTLGATQREFIQLISGDFLAVECVAKMSGLDEAVKHHDTKRDRRKCTCSVGPMVEERWHMRGCPLLCTCSARDTESEFHADGCAAAPRSAQAVPDGPQA